LVEVSGGVGFKDPVVEINNIETDNRIGTKKIFYKIQDLGFGEAFELTGRRGVGDGNGNKEPVEVIPSADFLKRMLGLQIKKEKIVRSEWHQNSLSLLGSFTKDGSSHPYYG